MKRKLLEFVRNLQSGFSPRKRLLLVVVATLCLIPPALQADGIGDILSLFQTTGRNALLVRSRVVIKVKTIWQFPFQTHASTSAGLDVRRK